MRVIETPRIYHHLPLAPRSIRTLAAGLPYGNLTNDTYSGAGSRVYDVENRMLSATNTSSLQSIYTYDADGRRVRRSSYNQEA
jgi:YD repeat-containing protein